MKFFRNTDDPYAAKKCTNCHYRGEPRPCPCWVENLVEKNMRSGEIRLVSECFYRAIPRLMTHVVQSADVAAASADKAHNSNAEMRDTLGQVAALALRSSGVLTLEPVPDQKALTNGASEIDSDNQS